MLHMCIFCFPISFYLWVYYYGLAFIRVIVHWSYTSYLCSGYMPSAYHESQGSSVRSFPYIVGSQDAVAVASLIGTWEVFR